MASLGTFGRRYDKIDLDFDWFGETIRVHPEVSQASLTEFLAGAADVPQDDEPAAAKLIFGLLRGVIHPDDFDRFWTIAKRERQDPQADLMPIAKAIVEAMSGFPTGQLSDSSAGSVPTPQSSRVDLPSPDVPAPVLTGGTTADRALSMLRKRPDLQEFVVMQEEAEQARSNGSAVS